jgi:hypothetical protein
MISEIENLGIKILSTWHRSKEDKVNRLENVLESVYKVNGLDTLSKISSICYENGCFSTKWKIIPDTNDRKIVIDCYEREWEYIIYGELGYTLPQIAEILEKHKQR